jgi:signal transduction histidine kinase
MAESEGATERPVGPGNRIIATSVLAWLAARGRSVERARLERALGSESAALANGSPWLDAKALSAVYAESGLSPGSARALGHQLAGPDALGLGLYRLGLGTPEKAYRRIQALLPRDEVGDRWRIESLSGGRVVLRYERGGHDESAPGRDRGEAVRCALRVGMLEAIPGLYGLLPARVRCEACLAERASACRYVVSWSEAPRRGLLVGAILSLALASGLLAVLMATGRLDGVGLLAAFGLMLSGPAIGRAVDLRRQLEAVAGARRGQLALFDQVDEALAEKLDALARVETRLDGGEPASAQRRAGSAEGRRSASPPSREIGVAARQIHTAAGELECELEAREGERATIGSDRGRVREIREWAAQIARIGDGDGISLPESTDAVRLVERALAAVRPVLPAKATVSIEAEAGLSPIECEPFLIEQVVVQLVKNAVEASTGLSEAPSVGVELRSRPQAVELSVIDRGVGIDSTEVDEVFDPFFGEQSLAGHEGMGLPACLRIVERHGGELHIEAEGRPGTRVSVLLPCVAGESLRASTGEG